MWNRRALTVGTSLVLWVWTGLFSASRVRAVSSTPHYHQHHGRRNQQQDQDGPAIYRLGVNQVLNEDGSHEEFFSCTRLVDDNFEEGTYTIQLSDETPGVDLDLLRRGQEVFLEIDGGLVTQNQIILTPDTRIQVSHSRPGKRRLAPVTSTGSFSPIIIRISTEDATPAFSASTLYSYLFDANLLSVKNQLEKCSANALTIHPDPLFGVIDVQLSTTAVGKTAMAITNLAEAKVNTDYSAVLNGQSIRNYADALLFVVPPGTGSWAAFATVSGKVSTYNDKWGGYLGALMHEISHNMGLRHAFENGNEYQDRSGYMGSIPQRVLYPERCFNGHNFQALSWYTDRFLEVEPEIPQLVKIAGFVDYSATAVDEYVVVQVGDLYLHFNRAVGFNKDSGEMRDELVIVEERTDGTDLLSGLKASESFTTQVFGESVTIQVCSVHLNVGTSAPHMLVSIGYGPTICPVVVTTPPPSPPPVPPPPTNAPTMQPSIRPVPPNPVPIPKPHLKPVLTQPPPPSAESPTAPNYRTMTAMPSLYTNRFPSTDEGPTVLSQITSSPSVSPTALMNEDSNELVEIALSTKGVVDKRKQITLGGIIGLAVALLVFACCCSCFCLTRHYRIVWEEAEPNDDGCYSNKVILGTGKSSSPDWQTEVESLDSSNKSAAVGENRSNDVYFLRVKSTADDWSKALKFWEEPLERRVSSLPVGDDPENAAPDNASRKASKEQTICSPFDSGGSIDVTGLCY